MAEEDVVEEQEEVRGRSFWSGTITFGLVSIPVELFPANRSTRVSLRMVTADGVPLARRYFCSKDGKELDWNDIVRGYEVEKDEYIVVADEELEKLAPEKTRDIDLRRFVPASEIDPIHFERAYYLTPGGNSTKAYRLLAATMEETDRAGIATFVMRGKEYLVAILSEKGILRAETLRFADEVRTAEDVGLPAPVEPEAAEVKKMAAAIGRLTKTSLAENELADQASERLLKLVAKKQKSGEDVYAAPAGEDVEASEGVIDLMEVLRRSLAGGSAPAKKASSGAAPKSAVKKTPAKKTSKKAAARTGAKKRTAKKTTVKKPAKKATKKKSAA